MLKTLSSTFLGKKHSLPKDLVINNKTIQTIRLVEEGTYSTSNPVVTPTHCFKYLAKDVKTEEFYTLKCLLIPEDHLMDKMDRELEILKALGGKDGISNFYGSVVQPPTKGSKFANLFLLIEHSPETLDMHVKKRIETKLPIPEGEIYSMFLDICHGVEHLHGCDPPIIHRDLRLEHVILTDGHCKLIDFSHSTTKVYRLENSMEIDLAAVDIETSTKLIFRSPEMCDLYAKKAIDTKSDIWALGCLLFRLCFNRVPFNESREVTKMIMNGIWITPDYPKYSHKLYDLLRKILVVDSVMRPDIGEVIDLVTHTAKWHFENILKPVELKSTQRKSSEGIKSPRDGLKALFSLSFKKTDPLISPRNELLSPSPRSDRSDNVNALVSPRDIRPVSKSMIMRLPTVESTDGKHVLNLQNSTVITPHNKPLPTIPSPRPLPNLPVTSPRDDKPMLDQEPRDSKHDSVVSVVQVEDINENTDL
jgi:serine/threonine protein kinase